MKKQPIFLIILSIIIVLLVVNFLFHLIYFNTIHKNIMPASESEKQKVIEILNKSMNLENYQIKIDSVYILNNKELVQVELIKGDSKKHYLVDLKEEKIVRR